MKKGLTEIILILDQSGSMGSIQSDIEGSLKSFIKDQKKGVGECNLTYYSFNDKVKRVFQNMPIQHVNNISLEPSGMTALYDAACIAIDEVGDRLAKTKESKRPERVLVLIVTDGLNNASKEFSNKDLLNKIKHQEDKYSWEFVYLGANQDAFSVGQGIGVKAGTSVSYNASSIGISNTFELLSNKTLSYRAGDSKAMNFSDADRSDALKQ